MNRKQLMQFARMVQTSHNRWPLHQWLDENVLGDITKVGTWAYYAHKFQRFLDTGKPEFSLFAAGNKKLSFKAWSVLPLVSCPGAGACAKFCYSFKAWRYPAAFFRQAQNLWLLNYEPCTGIIEEEWMKLPQGITVRLYVDGDIHDLNTLAFWFLMLNQRPDIKAYGYSKSWDLFLRWHELAQPFPPNYKLNLSSGSKYSEGKRRQMMELPCTRGDFLAVTIDKLAAKAGHKTKEYNKAVRNAVGKRVFVCPGTCDSCTPQGHACGLESFTNVPIAIGLH
jgi:hypothetical protein